MAKPILVANWKNHPGSIAEARNLLNGLAKNSKLYKNLSVFIAPPAPYFELVSGRKNFASLAAQDLALPVEILKSFGVRLAIIGHSDRRAQGESSEMVSQKIKLALKAGIVPLLCIGEKTRDADGEHFEYLREELKASLAGISAKMAREILIAYEPAWAIGKTAKDALPSAELAQSVIFLKKQLADLYGRKIADNIPILYGGSVEPENAGTLMRETYVRGFLVGHASLDRKSFEKIARSLTEK